MREMYVSPRGCCLCAVLLAPLLGCGGSPAGPSAETTSATNFQLTCQPSAFSGLGCGSGTCSVSSSGVTGEVRLACADVPAGVTCGLGPDSLSLSPGAAKRTGFTVSVDPTVLVGQGRLRIVGTAAGAQRSFDISISAGPAPPTAAGDRLTIFGCAGYTAGIPNSDSLQTFGSVYVGAWLGPNPGPSTGFCSQVVSATDGSFVLEIGKACVREGEKVYPSAGGLPACLSVDYHQGARVFADVIGRRACP